jgi:hypothetical protein
VAIAWQGALNAAGTVPAVDPVIRGSAWPYTCLTSGRDAVNGASSFAQVVAECRRLATRIGLPPFAVPDLLTMNAVGGHVCGNSVQPYARALGRGRPDSSLPLPSLGAGSIFATAAQIDFLRWAWGTKTGKVRLPQLLANVGTPGNPAQGSDVALLRVALNDLDNPSVVDASLLGWWPLNQAGGSNVLDFSGHGYDGTWIGPAGWVAKLFGSGPQLVGWQHPGNYINSNAAYPLGSYIYDYPHAGVQTAANPNPPGRYVSYVNLNSYVQAPSVPNPTNAITLAAWVTWDGIAQGPGVIMGGATGYDYTIFLWLQDAHAPQQFPINSLSFMAGGNGCHVTGGSTISGGAGQSTLWTPGNPASSLQPNIRTHIAATWAHTSAGGDNVLRMYINGVAVPVAANTTNTPGTVLATAPMAVGNYAVQIGSRLKTVPGPGLISGGMVLEDARVYSRALSASEIGALAA